MALALTANERWLDVAQRCDHATFFHTPHWQRLAAEVFPSQRDATVALELPGGATAILPMVEMRRLGARECVSTFTGAYGGPISERPLDEDAALRLQSELMDWRTAVKIVGNPLAAPLRAAPGMRAVEDYSLVLPLDGSFAAIERRFTKGHRSAMTKATRSGVSVRIGETVEDYRAYFELYRGSLERWGAGASSAYPWELFAAGQRLARELPDRMRLWLALHDSAVVAGAWVFYWNRHAIWWHGAADPQALELRPNNLLIPAIAEAALEAGYELFDMGATGGHEGPARFKRHFGAEPRPLRHLEYQPPLLGAARAALARGRALRGRSR